MNYFKVLVLLFIMSVFAVSLCAEEPVKYEVEFTIKYNAMTPEEATELIGLLLLQHKDSCKVNVDIKKVGDSDGYVLYDNATFTGSAIGTWE